MRKCMTFHFQFSSTYFALCISVSVSEVVILVYLINDIYKCVCSVCVVCELVYTNSSNAEETTQLRRKVT